MNSPPTVPPEVDADHGVRMRTPARGSHTTSAPLVKPSVPRAYPVGGRAPDNVPLDVRLPTPVPAVVEVTAHSPRDHLLRVVPTLSPLTPALPSQQIFEAEAWPHFPLLLRAARKALGDFNEAEDVVQQVYLQAWQSFAAYTPGTNCRAWLFRILFFKLKHCQHTRAAQALRFVYLDDLSASGAPFLMPYAEELSEEREAIYYALQQVGAPFREVVELALLEGFAYREIAAQLEIPIGTVMSRLSRGRALMRKALAHE